MCWETGGRQLHTWDQAITESKIKKKKSAIAATFPLRHKEITHNKRIENYKTIKFYVRMIMINDKILIRIIMDMQISLL